MRTMILMLALCAACASPRRDPGAADASGGGTDSGGNGGGSGGGGGEIVYVYAHTASTLYKVDPDTLAVTEIAPFKWPTQVGTDQMTDIAVDKTGQILGVSFSRVYKVDPATATCTLLSSSLDGTFNGLSFVPAAMLGQTGDDVLVGTRNGDGIVNRIDPMTGAASQVGDMGNFRSSGDLVAIAGFGTVQTVLGSSHDELARLAPMTFAATAIGSTGYDQIWGIAYWKGKVFGFTQTGDFLVIDPNTGASQVVQSGGPAWWGAGVTTLAPVIQ